MLLSVDLAKSGSNQQRKDDSRLRMNLHTIRPSLDLPPTDSLIRPRAGITPIKLLGRINIHSALSPIAVQTRISNMMLDEPAAENNHPSARGAPCELVDPPDILDDVDDEPLGRALKRVEMQHVAERAVCERGTEDGDVVFGCPVEDRALVVDFLAEPRDDGAGCPD